MCLTRFCLTYSRVIRENKMRLEINSSLIFLVEMGESRTPRPNEPIREYTTGIVDVLFDASDSHRQDSSALALWS